MEGNNKEDYNVAFTNLRKVKQFTILLTMSVYLLSQKEFAQYVSI